ncbi:23S rRNA (guanosine(2251)-2'-O)-methyltransferase RlmB [Aestuariivirga sp. YIM B02566]|uniref:23S rRNA (Guanosine(2251)-2'-O)-methyltransferase RlmB n=1 Tax=Taklimakanibacter albus TaxID=2800327 RepID=A0ACC5QXQ4_9HYPH|nr:23S rRNA (guanosine(2251)-2'-O)-methyltransferase RlmB [Aestuariivirga sp. YIM B02566]MBK1864968.1 23S rRNA (guanosine(2251)-2'-O)-methyltransferase RlmB [Aestuariivirga sp. YIM B02566]
MSDHQKHQPGNDEIERLYGVHTVGEALKNPKRKFIKLLATKNAADRLAAEIAQARITIEPVLPRELDRLLGPEAVHQGLVLDCKPLRQPRLDEIPREGIVVLLDQVTDPHNVGAIMRSCAAFGVTALVATARHSPEASGVLLKSASGAYEHVPFTKVTNLSRAMAELRDYGFLLVGLDSEAAEDIGDARLSRPVALVLGAEGKGLRRLTRDTCDTVVRLDMPGLIKSLNVSNAAAIALYALHRSGGSPSEKAQA